MDGKLAWDKGMAYIFLLYLYREAFDTVFSFVFLQRNRMNTINVLLLSLLICLDT